MAHPPPGEPNPRRPRVAAVSRSETKLIAMAKNYYVVLGLSSAASSQQIKEAFRRLAKELHPDQSGKESAPFQELQEAYSVLSDPVQRRHYDKQSPSKLSRVNAEPFSSPVPFPQTGPKPLIPEISLSQSFERFRPSFEELFSRWWSNFSPASRPKAERLESVTVEVLLSAEEVRRGGVVSVKIPLRICCPSCQGRGGFAGFECWRCAGTGIWEGEYPLRVSYPPGFDSIVQVPLSGLGFINFYLTIRFRVG